MRKFVGKLVLTRVSISRDLCLIIPSELSLRCGHVCAKNFKSLLWGGGTCCTMSLLIYTINVQAFVLGNNLLNAHKWLTDSNQQALNSWESSHSWALELLQNLRKTLDVAFWPVMLRSLILFPRDGLPPNWGICVPCLQTRQFTGQRKGRRLGQDFGRCY